MYMQFQ